MGENWVSVINITESRPLDYSNDKVFKPTEENLHFLTSLARSGNKKYPRWYFSKVNKWKKRMLSSWNNIRFVNMSNMGGNRWTSFKRAVKTTRIRFQTPQNYSRPNSIISNNNMFQVLYFQKNSVNNRHIPETEVRSFLLQSVEKC